MGDGQRYQPPRPEKSAGKSLREQDRKETSRDKKQKKQTEKEKESDRGVENQPKLVTSRGLAARHDVHCLYHDVVPAGMDSIGPPRLAAKAAE